MNYEHKEEKKSAPVELSVREVALPSSAPITEKQQSWLEAAKKGDQKTLQAALS